MVRDMKDSLIVASLITAGLLFALDWFAFIDCDVKIKCMPLMVALGAWMGGKKCKK